MKPTTPWKPNTSGLPDPFFNGRREYLEKLNAFAYSRHVREMNDLELTLDQFFTVPYDHPCDPDTFHPTAGYAVPISDRGQIKDVTR